jgi:tetratricopeptide (TPR) repeat protein
MSLNNLADLYSDQGRYSEAEPLFKRSLAIDEKALGPSHPYVATSLNDLASLYNEMGRYTEAEPLYKRALTIDETNLGPDHPEVANDLNNLAELYRRQARYADAEPLYKRALTIWEKTLGPDHPQVATAAGNLAALYDEQHLYAEAELLFKRAVTIDEKRLGPDHPDVAISINNLATFYADQHRYADAEALWKRSLAIWEKAFGPDHPDVATNLNNLAALYDSQHRYADAEPLYKRALAIREKSLGPDHPDVAGSRNDLAASYAEQGRYADALPLVRTATERGFVSSRVHLATLLGAWKAGLVADADAIMESFSVVQKASSSAASAALGQLAVRFATGSGDLARLVRTEQDLATTEDRLDKAVLAEVSKAAAERNKDKEQALRAELDKTAKSLSDVRTELAARFPDYVALSRPQEISATDVQAHLGEDEALVVIDLAAPGATDDYVWALTHGSAVWKHLGTGKGQIADEVTALRAQLDPNANNPFDAKLAYPALRTNLRPNRGRHSRQAPTARRAERRFD